MGEDNESERPVFNIGRAASDILGETASCALGGALGGLLIAGLPGVLPGAIGSGAGGLVDGARRAISDYLDHRRELDEWIEKHEEDNDDD